MRTRTVFDTLDIQSALDALADIILVLEVDCGRDSRGPLTSSESSEDKKSTPSFTARITHWNKQWTQFVSSASRAEQVRDLSEFVVESDWEVLDEEALTQGLVHVRLLTSTDDVRWFAIKFNHLVDNQWTAVCSDIHSLKLAFEDSDEPSSSMHLNAYKQASVAMTRMISTLSHEVRTPLNGICGMTDLLADTPLNQEQKGMCDVVQTCSQLLLVTFDDVLDFSMIQSGRSVLKNDPFQPRGCLQLIESIVRPLAKNKTSVKLTFQIDNALPRYLTGDANRIKQITLNLVQNAVKFTDDGTVSVQVWGEHCQEDHYLTLVVQVKDTGIGMSNETINCLFTPFTQGDSTSTRSFGGVGLGLSICKMLVVLMNGSLQVESKLAEGSVLTARMRVGLFSEEKPVKSLSDSSSSLTMSNAYSVAQARVLIVEDNSINAMIMKRILQKFGVENVVVKCDGLEGLEYYISNAKSIDVIFMDCAMPRMSGMDATRNIRIFEERNHLHHVPIVAVTAGAAPFDIEVCFQAGFDEFVAKPYTQQTLQNALLKYCAA